MCPADLLYHNSFDGCIPGGISRFVTAGRDRLFAYKSNGSFISMYTVVILSVFLCRNYRPTSSRHGSAARQINKKYAIPNIFLIFFLLLLLLLLLLLYFLLLVCTLSVLPRRNGCDSPSNWLYADGSGCENNNFCDWLSVRFPGNQTPGSVLFR